MMFPFADAEASKNYDLVAGAGLEPATSWL